MLDSVRLGGRGQRHQFAATGQRVDLLAARGVSHRRRRTRRRRHRHQPESAEALGVRRGAEHGRQCARAAHAGFAEDQRQREDQAVQVRRAGESGGIWPNKIGT